MKVPNNSGGISDRRFYITTPIFYPNAKLHLGHAYTTTIADILARYHRLKGDETYLLAGSDENTQKMIDAARKDRKEPMVFLDEIVKNFWDLYAKLGISYDQFIRTTDQRKHWPGAQSLWKKLSEAGDIYKKKYHGLYCLGHESFITEKDLVNGKCPDHGTKPEFLEEENYFFRLSKYGDRIKEKIKSEEMKIVPGPRKNEILSFLTEGLEDVSFSRPRRVDWPKELGIPVPGDDSQVMYVWCDALVNYISALGYGRKDETLFRKFWPADVHVIGKDILRFHAAIWPAMLLSAGLPLPKTVLVHGFITSGGKKMSKTLGNTIDPLELIDEYGVEAVRYYLARRISPFEDGDLTRESFRNAYNGDLANGLGNLVSRIMKMAVSNNIKLRTYTRVKPADFDEKIETFNLKSAMDLLWLNILYLDGYIQKEEPFKKIKVRPDEARKNIEFLLNDLQSLGENLLPFLPETSKTIIECVKTNKMPDTPLFPRKD